MELVGGSAVPAVILGLVLAVAARRLDWSPSTALPGIAISGGLLLPWLFAPQDLYPRFTYWMVPVLALGAGRAVADAPWLLAAVSIWAVAALAPLASDWTDDEIPNRALAQRAGPDTCMIDWMPQQMDWYSDLPVGTDCSSVALLHFSLEEDRQDMARAAWPVLCWRVPGASLRATTADECPNSTTGRPS